MIYLLPVSQITSVPFISLPVFLYNYLPQLTYFDSNAFNLLLHAASYFA